ncbi:MAG TPA: hypothetical protein H9935_14680 [Candidatus Blautia merdigallinarum]|uniref:Uncharacterized protein n=1 Tax=Candidatus Blautia merdigallinarum TaxID=2838495 RepID=A0A9D2SLW5_9FIRM|nr:hypothetical protein [Candidatus Blautia merdigallinarum]
MRDLYEVFNDLNLEEEKDLEVMNDLPIMKNNHDMLVMAFSFHKFKVK